MATATIGFLPIVIKGNRESGSSVYVGDGSNVWPAVHRLGAAHLFCLALENAPAGSVLHAIDDEAVPFRDIAEVIGRHLNLPLLSLTAEEAVERFGWVGRFLMFDKPASSALTRDLLGWNPTGPKLLEDLEQGHYFRVEQQ